ncbi:MAG TPA: transglutaminase-like domain-containing protein, partial [candidate division Zixibacteria bacterium]
ILIKIALLDDIDYSIANILTELFWRQNKDDKKYIERIKSLLSKMRVGNKVAFWSGRREYLKMKIKPLTSATRCVTRGEYKIYYFKNPPQKWGVNFAEFETEIEVKRADGLRSSKGVVKKPNRNLIKRLVRSTDFWPVDSESIDSLRKKLDLDDLEDGEKVIWIHHWIKSNIRSYPGPSKRWSVEKTIISKRGNCWEVSDLFVTLCRKYGIPARQLGGWLYRKGKISVGHAWAEVFLKNYGWIPIDALRRSLRIPDYYIPYFATDDGRLPVVYLSKPRVLTG